MVPLAQLDETDFHVLRADRYPDPLTAKSDAG
jgi:hypothetical protein